MRTRRRAFAGSFFLLMLALGMPVPAAAQAPWKFVSIPDLLNVDVGDISTLPSYDGGANSTSPSWEATIGWVLDRIVDENPDVVIVVGDLVMGHWDQDLDGRGIFGTPNNFGQEQDRIDAAADHYYAIWKQRLDVRSLAYLAAIGDHEIGDNPWNAGTTKADLVPTYKSAFGRHFTAGPEVDRALGTGFDETAFSSLVNNVLFVAVDPFRQNPDGSINTTVDGAQLAWLDSTLTAAASDPNVDHVIVMSHAPTLVPVRRKSSSGLVIQGAANSAFWQTLVAHQVELFLAGEMHAMTVRQDGGVEQVVHGGLMGFNPQINYLVGTVHPDRIELELKQIDVINSGSPMWQTGFQRPSDTVEITPANQAAGFQSEGTLTIDESGGRRRFLNRTGFFQSAAVVNGGFETSIPLAPATSTPFIDDWDQDGSTGVVTKDEPGVPLPPDGRLNWAYLDSGARIWQNLGTVRVGHDYDFSYVVGDRTTHALPSLTLNLWVGGVFGPGQSGSTLFASAAAVLPVADGGVQANLTSFSILDLQHENKNLWLELVAGAGPGQVLVDDFSLAMTARPCRDNVDNDDDGAIDFPADPGCSSLDDPDETDAGLVCDDDLDNDSDGFVDFPADLQCMDAFDASEQPDCSDTLDNDGDGLVDFPSDPGCSSAGDLSEKAGALVCDDGADNDFDGLTDFPQDPECNGPLDVSETADCADGFDNDGDTLIDLADPGCSTALDTTETDPALVCDDGIDNDGDGLVDGADPGCDDAFDASEQSLLLACDDGVDNDLDGLVDLADPGCDDGLDASELSALACDDGIDNDADTFVDLADPDCADGTDPSEGGGIGPCDDGADNDGDGLIDLADPGCDDSADGSEQSPLLVCDDGLDNDGDGLSDAADPGCDDPTDASEVAQSCLAPMAVTADTHLKANSGSNFGNQDDLRVGPKGGDWRSLVRFDLSSLPGGSTVSSATLRLYQADGNGNGLMVVRAHRIGETWTELGADWTTSDNSTPWAGGPGGTFDAAFADAISINMNLLGWYEWDVASIAQTWSSDPSSRHGVLLIAPQGSGGQRADFVSRDSASTSLHPELLVCVTSFPCDDGVDNDGDGLADLADPGCANPSDPSENSPSLVCDDGADNDGDGLIDTAADPGCSDPTDESEQSALLVCDDGLDNDGDGLADLADPGCSSPTDPSERSPLLTCDDGVDNDGDAFVDLADPGCDDVFDATETSPSLVCDDGADNDGDGLVDVADPGCDDVFDTTETSPSLVCDDGADNDGDGLVDAADPGCDDPTDPSEQSPSLACDDGADNDGDALVDLADPGCDSPGDVSEQSPGLVCDDGADNDGDGLVDLTDPGCDDGLDATETSPSLVCDDGADNDGDGLVDVADPGCDDVFDTTETSPSLVCDDGADNDGDGLVDLTDPGCDDGLDTTETSPSLVCDDGADNDGDGLVDLTDPGCDDGLDTTETSPSLVCDDGADNDADGLVDLADPGCDDGLDIAETSPSLICDDGLDNDGDGLVDLGDAGCDDGLDPSEHSPSLPCDNGLDDDGDGWADFPADPGCLDTSWSTEQPACQDGINNDGKTGIDYDGGASLNGGVPIDVADPQCVGKPWRKSEGGGRCGLGFELALMLPALLGLRRRSG